VIAFTHKPILGDDPVAVENRRLITTTIKAGFTINLSADNPCGQARELEIAPVATVLAQAYARRAVRQRFKETARSVGRNNRRMAGSHGFVAAVYARRKANSSLPGDLFGRDLQELWCLRSS
jgi:hypothetical protein